MIITLLFLIGTTTIVTSWDQPPKINGIEINNEHSNK